MRWLRRLLLLVLVLLVVLPLGALLVLQTGPGRDGLAGLVERQVPGLRIEGLAPGLPGHLGFRRVTLADAGGIWLTAEEGAVDLDLMALLSRRVRLGTARLGRLALERLPPADPAAPPAGPPALPRLPQLPVALEVAALDLPRIELGAALLGQPARLALEGMARLDGAGLAARATLTRQDQPLTARLEASFDARRLEAGFDERRLLAQLQVDEPAGGLLGRLAGQPESALAARLNLDGPLAEAPWSLSLALGEARLVATGQVGLAADGKVRLALDATASPGPLLPPAVRPLAEGLTLAGALSRAPDGSLLLERLRLAAPPGEITAAGRIGADTPPELGFTARLGPASAFGALLPPGPRWDAIGIEGRLAGTAARPRLTAELRPVGLRTGTPAADQLLGPAPLLWLDAPFDLRGIAARLEAAGFNASLDGDAGETLDLRLAAALAANQALPGGIRGEGRLAATLAGPRTNPDATLRVDVPALAMPGFALRGLAVQASAGRFATAPWARLALRGDAQGLPLRIGMAAHSEARLLRLDNLEASLGPARLTASGSYDPETALAEGEARLEATDLAPLGALAGQPLAGRLSAQLTARAPAGAQALEARLSAPALRYGAIAGRLEATARGSLAELGFTVEGGALDGTLRATGQVQRGPGRLTVELASLSGAWHGETLASTAPLRVTQSAEGVTLENLALRLGRGGRIEGNGRLAGEALAGSLAWRDLPLSLAALALPQPALAGTLAGELRLGGRLAAPEATLRLTGAGLAVQDPALARLPPATLAAEASLRGAAIAGRATLAAGPGLRLEAAASLPQGVAGPLTASLRGRLEAALAQAVFLAGGADRLGGAVELDLRAEGSVAAPRLAGGVTLADLSYRNAETGVRLDGLRGRLLAEGERIRLVDVAGRTPGGGTLALAGQLSPLAPGLPVDVTLTARGLRQASPDLGEVQLTADLALRGELAGAARAEGRIAITGGELRIPDNLPASVPVLTGVREVGRAPPGRPPRARPAPPRSGAAGAPPARSAAPPLVAGSGGIALAIAVEVPGRLWLRGRGLEAELGGRLNIGGTTASPVVTGALETRQGRLELAGRRLELARGAVRFDRGELIPSIDVQATSRTTTHTLTIGLVGAATQPEVQLSATPELPRDEVLARLLFDRPSSALSPLEIAQSASALAQLAGLAAPGSGAINRLRALLGLDRLGVGSAGANDPSRTGAAVEAGRYVAPGVFVGVQQGTDGRTSVGVQVELLPRLRLEGSNGTGPAGQRLGLTYEYEY